MEELSGLTTTDETVIIDEVKLSNCHLINCQLVYRGGDVNMNYTRTDGCIWTFEGSALKTITLLQTLGMLVGDPRGWVLKPNIPIHEA